MQNTRKKIWQIFGLVVIWRVIIQLFIFLTKHRLNLNVDLAYDNSNINIWVNTLPNWLKSFANWDSGWYLSIANQGYHYIDQTTNAVFFPLYPLLIRYIGNIFKLDYLLTGLIISLLAIFIALIYLYKLIKIDYSENIAWSSLIFLLIFPTALFFSLVYTEALFICLVIMTFYYARQNQWPLVGIIGFFVVLTKPWGIALLIPLLIEYYQNLNFSIKKTTKSISYFLLMPLGLLLHTQFLKIKFGSYFIFMSGQKMWLADNAYNFLLTFKNYFNNIFIYISDNPAFQSAITLDFIFFVFGLTVSFYIFFKIRKSYGVYTLLTCLIPALTGIFVSMSRYILVAFPIYIMLALWSEKNKLIQFSIYLISLMLFSLFTILFINNYWVA